ADQESADRDRRVGEEAEEPEARRDRPRLGGRRGLDLPFYFPSIESHAPILRAGPMRRKAAGRAFAAVRAPRSAARRPPLSPCSEAGACSWATAAIARSTSCPRRNRKMKDQVRNRKEQGSRGSWIAGAVIAAGALLFAAAPGLAAGAQAKRSPAAEVAALGARALAADYRADIPELHEIARELGPFANDPHVGAWARYWRGFAFWRSAGNLMNGDATNPRALTDL